MNYFTILSNIVEIAGFYSARTERGLDASSAAKSDRHLIAVNNHRNRASALAESQHALQLRRVLLDVDVLERDLPPLKVVTGGLRIGSGVFAEDEDHEANSTLGSDTGQVRVRCCDRILIHCVRGEIRHSCHATHLKLRNA